MFIELPARNTISSPWLDPSHPSAVSLNIAPGGGLTTQSKVGPLAALTQGSFCFFPYSFSYCVFACLLIASLLQPVNNVRIGMVPGLEAQTGVHTACVQVLLQCSSAV